VVPVAKILMLNTLRYADELRPTKDFALPGEGLKGAHVTSKEVDLAKRLIDDMTEPWNASEFKDTYHQDLMRRIREKIKKGETKEITGPDTEEGKEPRSAQVIDLAALLKQSLDKSGPRHKAADPRRSPGTEAGRKTALRVVASARGSAKAPARRKRA
jgi:DNA end-binding protein Ku